MTGLRHQATEAVHHQAITEVLPAVRHSMEAAGAAAAEDTAEAEVQADTEDNILI